MLSSFVSREFGFGRLLTNDELAKITLERRASTATYTDKHAAMEILGTINKPVLMESPFVRPLASSWGTRTDQKSTIGTVHAQKRKRCNHRYGGLILLTSTPSGRMP